MAGIKVIITGATGMVGEGVLFECLRNTAVSEVLIINRRHYELQHPKLKELLVPDFFRLTEYAGKIQGTLTRLLRFGARPKQARDIEPDIETNCGHDVFPQNVVNDITFSVRNLALRVQGVITWRQ